MIPRELMKRIRRIQIKTSRIVDEMLAGQWHSAFKGRGVEFEEVRPYQIGDDVRSIDWNVTARTGEPFIKLFREERELAVMLLVDLSQSQAFGTQVQSKQELVSEFCATLAFSAIRNNDRVGLTLFTDGIEKFVPPRKGSRHVQRLVRELLYCEPVGSGTDISAALEHLNRTAHRRTVVFLVSDFQGANFEKTLRMTRRRHDVIPLVVRDERETEMPNVGLIQLRDAETGEVISVDTSSSRVRRHFKEQAESRQASIESLFRRMKCDWIELKTGEDFVEPLQTFFLRRERKR